MWRPLEFRSVAESQTRWADGSGGCSTGDYSAVSSSCHSESKKKMSLLDEDFITIEKNEILSKSKLTKSTTRSYVNRTSYFGASSLWLQWIELVKYV